MLVGAMSLARQVEQMDLARLPPPAARGAPCALLPAPAPKQPLLALSAPPAAAAQPRQDGPPLKRLSPEEQTEWHRLGLCFNCNEPYARGHNHVCRRIFYLNGVEIAAADEEPAGDVQQEEAPAFSLKAVAGMPICDSMQVRVSLGATTLVALLDTGSTHNFIAEDAARRTGLPVQPHPRLTATVANGERVTCPGVIRHAPVIIEGETFFIDLFAMLLAGYDLVLGTHWMVTRGRVVWDFIDRTVSFQHQGQRVSWSDVADRRPPLLAATTTPNALLEELLHSFAGVFAEAAGYHRSEHGITPLSSSPALHLWQFGPTATRRHTRTSWSGNAPPCWTKASYGAVTRRSCRRYYWSRSRMGLGGFAWTTAP